MLLPAPVELAALPVLEPVPVELAVPCVVPAVAVPAAPALPELDDAAAAPLEPEASSP